MQAGDLKGAAACLDQDLGARWEAVLAQLPRSIRYVELGQVEHVDGALVAVVSYSGEAGHATVRQRWELRRGRPTIVEASVVRR
jgi:hypothetical protein